MTKNINKDKAKNNKLKKKKPAQLLFIFLSTLLDTGALLLSAADFLPSVSRWREEEGCEKVAAQEVTCGGKRGPVRRDAVREEEPRTRGPYMGKT